VQVDLEVNGVTDDDHFPSLVERCFLILCAVIGSSRRAGARIVRAGEAEAVADRQEPERGAVLDPAPEAAREDEREDERRRAEPDNIRRAETIIKALPSNCATRIGASRRRAVRLGNRQ
jgi:hypothetical protein